MTDLVEFLRARLDEDEEAAQAVMARQHATDPLPTVFRPWDLLYSGDLDPAVRRLLAEVEAKRRIVSLCDLADDNGYDIASEVLALLALPYADHPDYDPAWLE